MHPGEEIKEAVARADAAEASGDRTAAVRHLEQALVSLKAFAMQSISEESRARRLAKAREIQARIDALRGGAARSAPPRAVDAATSAGASVGDDHTNEHRVAARGLICRANITWDDIGGLDRIRDELGRGFALALCRRPQGVRIDGFRNIMLYGPPGTGKTMIAAAVSNQLGATFFNVKASDLLSKYFGESTKLVDALYAEAKDAADAGLSVVFIDEFDSLCPDRDGGASGAERRLLSTLLAVLDGLSEKGEDSGVITLAATNLPWALDPAVLSRFQRRILIGYPDETQRRAILSRLFAGRGLACEVPVEELARSTEGCSGRDLEGIVRLAVGAMIDEANPDLASVASGGAPALAAHTVRVGPVSRHHVEAAVAVLAVDVERRRQDQARHERFL